MQGHVVFSITDDDGELADRTALALEDFVSIFTGVLMSKGFLPMGDDGVQIVNLDRARTLVIDTIRVIKIVQDGRGDND